MYQPERPVARILRGKNLQQVLSGLPQVTGEVHQGFNGQVLVELRAQKLSNHGLTRNIIFCLDIAHTYNHNLSARI